MVELHLDLVLNIMHRQYQFLDETRSMSLLVIGERQWQPRWPVADNSLQKRLRIANLSIVVLILSDQGSLNQPSSLTSSRKISRAR